MINNKVIINLRVIKKGYKLKKENLTSIILLFIGALIVSFPVVWAVINAFKPESEIYSTPPTLLPLNPTIQNFITVWTEIEFAKYFRNTLFLAAIACLIICYTSSLAGYVLAKMRFKGRGATFLIIIFTMMFPWSITILTSYKLMFLFGWNNNYLSLIIPAAFSPFGIFLLRQFCITIPDELLEAARIDGASEFRIFHKIVLPLLGPPISALGIFVFLWFWEDFLWPYLMINSNNLYTVTLGLNRFVGQYTTRIGPTIAGSSLVIVPVLIFYFIFQKNFIEGISLSGINE